MTKNVLEWLEATAAAEPSTVAYRDESSVLTFGELLHQAQAIGSALAHIADRTPIAVMSSRAVGTVAAFLGVVYSGHAYAPIDGTLPEQRVRTILSILKPKAILADAAFLDRAHAYADGAEVYALDACRQSPVNSERLNIIRKAMIETDPLYVIFTSGSTGKPKGVLTSHQSLMCYISSYAKVMKIDANDILGNQSPLDYIAAIRDIYLPLYKGCSAVIIPKAFFMQPNALFEYMNESGVTSVGWSVSAFTIPLSLGAFKEISLTTLRKICFSGSVMPMTCLKTWMQHLPNADFVNQYGPTEATASCTYHRVTVDDLTQSSLPIGKPYDHYRVFLLNEDLTETPNGEVGEICVSGPTLALGYYNDPERTATGFVLNPNVTAYPERMYRTGDYGRLREDGELEFRGRMDRQIKHMGHRVELDEIEIAANAVDGVNECVCLYHAEKETIVLFYAGPADKRTVGLALRKALPVFMIPRKLFPMTALPKLPNGKLDMATLKGTLK